LDPQRDLTGDSRQGTAGLPRLVLCHRPGPTSGGRWPRPGRVADSL